VVEDKKRGLVARLAKTGPIDEDKVRHTLGEYTNPWEWAA
jgi:fatty-acyl-CoA synthase